jgi:hypothetical protein
MGAWLRRQQSWLVAEPLPAYAPELNPVEPLWSSLKGAELANLAGESLEEVIAAAERGIQWIRHTHHLAFSFLCYCGLSPMVSNDHVTGMSEPLYNSGGLLEAGKVQVAASSVRGRSGAFCASESAEVEYQRPSQQTTIKRLSVSLNPLIDLLVQLDVYRDITGIVRRNRTPTPQWAWLRRCTPSQFRPWASARHLPKLRDPQSPRLHPPLATSPRWLSMEASNGHGFWGGPTNVNPQRSGDLPEITDPEHAASDHAAIFVDINI